jgi:hypothetical protein
MHHGSVVRGRKARQLDLRSRISNRVCCRLEFRVTRWKQTPGRISNRRNSAITSITFFAPLRVPKSSAIMTALDLRTI